MALARDKELIQYKPFAGGTGAKHSVFSIEEMYSLMHEFYVGFSIDISSQ